MGHPLYDVVSGSLLFNREDLLALPVEKRARAGLFLSMPVPPGYSWRTGSYLFKRIPSYAYSDDISVD